MVVLFHIELIEFQSMFFRVICDLVKRILLLCLKLFQILVIADLVYVDLYSGIIYRVILNVLKGYLNLKLC